MACSMTVVQTLGPKKLPSQRVEGEATDTFWKFDLLKSNVAFQNKRVCFAFHLCRFAKVKGSCSVGCAVQILSSRIAEIDCLWINNGTAAPLWLVVNYCRIWASGR